MRAGYDGWDSYDNQNIISAASSVPFPEIIAFLMERGVNFRKSDGSIFTSNLSQAIYYDFVEYAHWFIEPGADFKHQEAQKNGWPRPSPVVYVQSHEMAEMLVAHGANPNLYNIVQKKIIWQGQLIAKAEHVNGFIFSVIFRNGEQKKLNIESYLRRHPAIFNDMLSNPDIAAAQMQYDCGELFWNDRMGIEAHTLYNLDKE